MEILKVTKSDIKKMEEEIEYRRLEERPKILEAVKEARAQGDLSENFEYYVAKRDRNQNDSRIRYLEGLIKNAVIIDDSSKDDEVGINNTVELYFEEDDEVETYRIVTPIRSDAFKNLVSIESPLGMALLGKKEGDRVFIQPEKGEGYYVVIKKLIKTNDDSQDKIKSF